MKLGDKLGLRVCSVLVCVGLCLAADSAAALVSLESAQSFVRETAGTNAANVVLYSPTDAVTIIDTVFKPNRRNASDYPDWKFERMKRLVSENLAVLVAYDGVGHEEADWQKTFATRVYCLVHRFNDRRQILSYRNDVEVVSYCPRSDYVYDELILRKSNGKRIFGIWEMDAKPEAMALLFGSDRNVGLDAYVGTNVEASVVADVETVTLLSVSGLEKIAAAGGAKEGTDDCSRHPVGHYRVSLLVRTTLAGEMPGNRLVFTAKTGETNATVDGHWLFYRGMTLKVGLRKTSAGHSVCRIEPVLPYPPHTTEGVVICENDIPASSRFSLIGRSFAGVKRGNVTILYGDHTRADYFSSINLIEGFCGALPDFGAQAWVCAWTQGSLARLDYWRNAWFADVQSCRAYAEDPESDEPLFRPAMDAFAAQSEDRIRFAWWDIVFPSVSFVSPATVKAAADFLAMATRPCLCSDKETCRVIADPCVADRPVRPFVASGVSAWDALQRIVSENGCAMSIEGTNVVLSADLTDAEVVVPCVDELAAELEKEGFGSATGARYARVSLWVRGMKQSKDAGEVVSAVDPFAKLDDESLLDGNGWVRDANDGTEQFLAYDAIWWKGSIDKDPKRKDDEKFYFGSSAVRLRRDCLRALDTLNLLAEGMFGWDLCHENDADVVYLALALHGCQAGFKAEGQQLIDALWRRPAAAKKALAQLRKRISRPEAKCRTLDDWYAWMRSAGKVERMADAGDKDNDDESDAD